MIYLVGPMPPPVHGASAVTERVDRVLRDAGFGVATCSTSAAAGSGGVRYHLSRMRAYGAAVLRVLGSRGGAVYHSLSGGAGLAYDLAVVAACRLRGLPIVFHHHSFAYLNAHSVLMAAIVGLTRARGTHTVLCPTMGLRLNERYGPGLSVEVVSNLGFFDFMGEAASRERLGAIGYLSNITREKGIDRFLDLVEALRKRGSQLRAVIAGPIGDPAVEAELKARCSAIGDCAMMGPVYGASKATFFASIDLFVFPSRYVNEAQPMVMFEAMAAALPVVGTERGCMRDLPVGEAVLLLDEMADNVLSIVDHLLEWEKSPARFSAVAAAAFGLRAELEEIAADDLKRFLGLMARVVTLRGTKVLPATPDGVQG